MINFIKQINLPSCMYVLLCMALTIIFTTMFLFLSFELTKRIPYNVHSPISLFVILIPCLLGIFCSVLSTSYIYKIRKK